MDGVSRAGLEGLSDYVNRRTAATLAEPDGDAGADDLSFYPLLYWPITADAAALDRTQAAALNDYMSRGGIVLIDTQGGGEDGSGAGFAPGTDDALQRVARGLVIPPLAPLTTEHVLARSFYLLQDFPGRFTGTPYGCSATRTAPTTASARSSSARNDWAAAWAVDAMGAIPTRSSRAARGSERWRIVSASTW